MLLENKIAVIFGAGGAIGSEVARVFAKEGATLFLSGRQLDAVEKVAKEIRASKGKAEAAEVDALNEKAVNAYLDRVVGKVGKIDAVFNAIGLHPMEAEQEHIGHSTEIPLDKFVVPLNTVLASQFLTAKAAAQHMMQHRSGVVIFLSATLSRGIAPWIAGFSAAFAAVEGLTRCLATEWSPSGVRVVCISSAGMLEAQRIQLAFEVMAQTAGIPKEALTQAVIEKTLLKRMPTVAETAKLAAFLASDRASTLTGAIINSSCGEVLD